MGRRNKRHRPAQPTKYLPGATWQDVMRGKPVTEAERQRAQAGPRTAPPAYHCRRCPNVWKPHRRFPNPRCTLCGSLMDDRSAE